MRGEAAGQTLQTTALVHEAYLRLMRSADVDWQNRAHFFAVAATVMRRILVDAARARRTDRRAGVKLPLTEAFEKPGALPDDPAAVLALNDALDRLALLDPRQARIVELRFFAGMTNEEAAQVLGTSERTVKRAWQLAKTWLYGELAR